MLNIIDEFTTMSGDPHRSQAQGHRRHRRPLGPVHPTRRAWPHPFRQRAGVHRQGRTRVDHSCRGQDRLHRARQPLGERLCRELQARLRDELLNSEIFYTLREAQIIIESWRRHYNAVRPHAALGYKAPAPEVFVPALAAWPAPQPRPTPPAMLPVAPRPTLN